MSPEVRSELLRLLSALCDSELGDAQHARLGELLEADPECRRQYLEYLDLHARLLTHPHHPASQTPSPSERPTLAEEQLRPMPAPVSSTARTGRPRRFPELLRYALVSVATLAASLLAQVYWWHPRTPEVAVAPAPAPPQYVATLMQAADCLWEDWTDARRVGARLPPGELRLRRGLARIHFDSGPDLIVEGPAILRIDSGTEATVLRGKVVFKGDEVGTPFGLHTPSSSLLDIGTEYAVAVGVQGDEEVHVFDGEVQRTPAGAPEAEAELLKAGEARRYAGAPAAPGQPTALDPARFVRQLSGPAQPPADPLAGLLAYEGFDYRDPRALPEGTADGGRGWAGPWTPGFARPLRDGDRSRLALNVREGLTRPGAKLLPAGGSFDYTGFAKYWRRLATPVRLDTEGVYFLSYLFRHQGPPADAVNALAVLLRTDDEIVHKKDEPWTRLNVGVGGASNELFTSLQRAGARAGLPLSGRDTYLLVAKVVASGPNPDQVFLRVYGPDEPVGREEPRYWSLIGPPISSDLVFDWLEVHVNSKTRQTIDEVRLGTTWSSVTAPWVGD